MGLTGFNRMRRIQAEEREKREREEAESGASAKPKPDAGKPALKARKPAGK